MATSFANYNSLPTELKLELIRSCHTDTLKSLLLGSKELENLTIHTINEKVSHLSELGLCIGIFSPQNESQVAELYDTKQALPAAKKEPATYLFSTSSQDPHRYNKSVLSLGPLQGTRDPLKGGEFVPAESAGAGAGARAREATDPQATGRLTLEVNEDSSRIQLHFGIHLRAEDGSLRELADAHTRIAAEAHEGVLEFYGGALKIRYNVTKGAEVPPKGPYEYEVFNYYYVEFSAFEIDNLFLIHEAEATL